MDHPTPFPGKTQPPKSKTLKSTDTSRITANQPPIFRQKRQFGTVRSTNILIKPVKEKRTIKPVNGILQKQTKPETKNNLRTKSTSEVSQNNSCQKPKTLIKKKSIDIQEKVESVVEPRTPVASPFIIKSKVAATPTPYHSARNCSDCRFDRLETASYWLKQIKLAESVGKHFVSVAFFRLALDSHAEPIMDVRAELRRYMGRHRHLSTTQEWRDISLAYGIWKDESCKKGVDSDDGKRVAIEPTSSSCDFDENPERNEGASIGTAG